MTDYISRQAAIDKLRNNLVYMQTFGVDRSITLLEELPSVDVPHWIPCSERLPHAEDKVLCCTMTKKGFPNIVIGYYLHGEHGSSWACGMNSNVVAWMPLPEPYKEEST